MLSMNRNLKATKNNLIKKAYLSVVVAVMAGFALFTHQDAFMSESSVVCEARIGGIGRRSLLGKKYFSEKKYTLSDDQKSNLENMISSWDYFESLISNLLDPKDLKSAVTNVSDISLKESMVKAVSKQIKESQEYRKLGEAIKKFNKVDSESDYSQKANGVIDNLLKLQEMVARSILDVGTIFRIPSMKNTEKLKQAQKVLADSPEKFASYIKKLNLESICKNEKTLDEAKKLVKDATRLLLENQDLNGRKVDKSTWKYYLNDVADRSYSRAVVPLASAFQVLLFYNMQINRILSAIGADHILVNYTMILSGIAEDVVARGYNNADDTKLSTKEDFIKFLLSRSDMRDLTVLPLVFALNSNVFKADVATSDQVASLKSFVESTGSNCTNYLVEAFYSNNRFDVGDVMSALQRITSTQSTKYNIPNRTITYSLNEALSGVLPDSDICERSFKYLDDTRRGMIEGRISYLNGIATPDNDQQSELNALYSALEMFNNNVNGLFKFLNSNGSLAQTSVEVDMSTLDNFISLILASPATIRIRAMAECVKNSLTHFGRTRFESLEKTFADRYGFMSALDKSVTWLKNIYNAENQIIEQFKKIKSSDVKVSEKSESYIAPKYDLSSWLPLSGGNIRLTNSSVENLSTGNIKISSPLLQSGVEYNAVLCPQGGTGDKTTQAHETIQNIKASENGIEIPMNEFKYKSGNAEIHIRSAKPVDGQDPFVLKVYGQLGIKSIQYSRRVKCTPEFVSAANSKLNRDTEPRCYLNNYGGLTIVFSGLSDIKYPYSLAFKQGASPNFEKDVYAMTYYSDEGMYAIHTKPLEDKTSKYEVHIYNADGALTSDNFLGKIVVDPTVSVTDETTSGYKGLMNIISKHGWEKQQPSNSKISRIEKKLKIEMPDDLNISDDVKATVRFVDVSGNVAHEQQMKLSKIYDYSNRRSYDNMYSGLVELPQNLQDCYMYIIDGFDSDEFDQLKSDFTINEKTTEDTVIRMRGFDSSKDRD